MAHELKRASVQKGLGSIGLGEKYEILMFVTSFVDVDVDVVVVVIVDVVVVVDVDVHVDVSVDVDVGGFSRRLSTSRTTRCV